MTTLQQRDNAAFLAWAAKRRERAHRLRERGWTLARIGVEMGISKQRVGQLLNGGKQA